MNNPQPIPLDLVTIVENIRTQARNRGAWVETAELVGMDSQRYRYFALNPGSVPAPRDLTKLIAYFMPQHVFVAGCPISAPVLPPGSNQQVPGTRVVKGWIISGGKEHEYYSDGQLTGRTRPIAPQTVAA